MNEFSLTLAGFDLTTIPYVEFSRRFPHELASREVKTARTARGHGQKLLSAFYASKVIQVEGYVEAPDRATMELARDQLLLKLQPIESNLDIIQGTQLRTYTVTMQNFIWSHIEGGFATFNVEFLASDPFGRDTQATFLTFEAPKTVATFDYPITIGGSFGAELEIAVALASGTGLTNKVMRISNPLTGEEISITRTFAANDSVAISVPNKTVTVNGSVVDYNGVFPVWQPGDQILRYTDTFTTRSVSLSGSYYKRYL